MDHTQPGTYAPLGDARFPWVNMHDRYFEDGIGGAGWWGKNEPLKAPWLKEVPWRVSTLNPGGQYFLEHYVMPLRYGDVLGFSKGGFLIGTAGVEQELLAFSRAFRALPAERFSDLSGSTATMKARVLKSASGNWFYAVNTSQEAVEVSFQFEGDATQILDAATGRPENRPILLKAYELRSFRTDGQAPVSVKCACAKQCRLGFVKLRAGISKREIVPDLLLTTLAEMFGGQIDNDHLLAFGRVLRDDLAIGAEETDIVREPFPAAGFAAVIHVDGIG